MSEEINAQTTDYYLKKLDLIAEDFGRVIVTGWFEDAEVALVNSRLRDTHDDVYNHIMWLIEKSPNLLEYDDMLYVVSLLAGLHRSNELV